MIERFSTSDKKLIIESDDGQIREMEFETKIHDCLLCKNSLIVHAGNNETYLSRNIFRVSEDGKITWQIEEPERYLGAARNRSVAFTYLGVKDGKLIAYSLNGFTYEIDFETGKLLNPVFTK